MSTADETQAVASKRPIKLLWLNLACVFPAAVTSTLMLVDRHTGCYTTTAGWWLAWGCAAAVIAVLIGTLCIGHVPPVERRFAIQMGLFATFIGAGSGLVLQFFANFASMFFDTFVSCRWAFG
jgi:hypothetical protein